MLLVAVPLLPSFAAEEYVVIDVKPDSHAGLRGQLFGVGDLIEIPAGASVTFLGDDGETIAVTGPQTLRVTPDGTSGTGGERAPAVEDSLLPRISSLFLNQRSDSTVLGASRNLVDENNHAPSSIWLIHADRDSTGCHEVEIVRLKRKATATPIQVQLIGQSGQVTKEIVWKRGTARLDIDFVAQRVSQIQALRFPISNRTLKLHQLPQRVSGNDPMSMIRWMIDANCTPQVLQYFHVLSHRAQGL